MGDTGSNPVLTTKKDFGWNRKINFLSLSIIKKNMNRQELVNTLKELDGETLEHVIRVIGMEDQMLRQLIMKAPILQVIDLVRERDYLDIAELKRGLAFESSDVIFID
jgi:hypothetical protein